MKKSFKTRYVISWIILTFSLTIFCALLPTGVFAAPAISGVNGTIANGQTVTINGSGFGSGGPNIVLYDNFEQGTNGGTVRTGSGTSTIGGWSEYISNSGYYPPRYSADYSRGGAKSLKVDFMRPDAGTTPKVRANFTGSTDVFFSYWHYWPTGTHIPGTNGPGIGGPNFKWFWLHGNDFGVMDYLVVTLGDFPSNSGDTVGPGANYDSRGEAMHGYWNFSGGSSMDTGRWQRVSGYFKASQSAGKVWFNMTTPSGNYTVCDLTGYTTSSRGDGLWHTLDLPGYGRGDSNSVMYFDDVYIATGSNARARVEIGNASTYSACTNLAISTPTAWSSGQITATLRQGSFTSGQSAYLFVVDAAGTPSAGYPITIGDSGGGTQPPPPPPCTTTINATSASLDSLAHTGSITVTASSSTCSWTAVSNASWITITSGASRTGSGTVGYSVSQNTSTQRTGTMTVAGQTFTVTQSAGGTSACSFTVTPGSVTLSSLAQTGSVSVGSSTSSCTWTAVSNSAWITVSSGSSGTRTGSGTVQYSVTQNTTTSSRTGTMTIAGKTVNIQQAAGSGMSCDFSLDKNLSNFDYLAQSGNITVTASAASCPWTAKSNSEWITTISGSSGTGSGNVTFSITMNTSSQQRSGTITVGGITYTVYQAAYGRKKPHPPRNLRTAN